MYGLFMFSCTNMIKKTWNVELDIAPYLLHHVSVYYDVCYLQDIMLNISALAWARVILVKTTVKLYSGNTH